MNPQLSLRIQETIEKVLGFQNLPIGWHFSEGVPALKELVSRAVEFLTKGGNLGFQKANAFPGIDGEISVTFYSGHTYLELILEVDGTVTFIHEENEKEVEYVSSLSFEQAVSKLENLTRRPWNSSESFTKSITIQTESDSIVSPSDRQAKIRKFQYSTKNVQLKQVPGFAVTLLNTTVEFPVYLQSSGKSAQKFYLKDSELSRRQAIPEILATTI